MEVTETLEELKEQINKVIDIIQRAGIKLQELEKKRDWLLEEQIDIFKPQYEIKIPASWFEKCNFLLWPNVKDKLTPEFLLQFRSIIVTAKDDLSISPREFDRATFIAMLATGGTLVTLRNGTIFYKY